MITGSRQRRVQNDVGRVLVKGEDEYIGAKTRDRDFGDATFPAR